MFLMFLKKAFIFYDSTRKYSFSDEKLEPYGRIWQLAHVHEDITNLEKAYETVVGVRGATLSGGQRQRVTIARALAKLKMIILDDFISSRHGNRRRNNKTLSETRKNYSCNFSQAKAVKDADKIFVFDDGKIVEEEIMIINCKEGIYYSMYIKQLIEKN